MSRIPFVIYGDGPRLHSGLARIARDLTARLLVEQEALGIRVLQVGIDYPYGWHWQGWDFYGFQQSATGDQGWGPLKAIEQQLQATGETERPIVLAIMDPARVFDLVRWHGDGSEDPTDAHLQVDIWGYFPLDAHNIEGAVGGPAAEAVDGCTRILGYGRYGAQVLRQTLLHRVRFRQGAPSTVPPVAYLPHGLEPGAFRPDVGLEHAHIEFSRWALQRRMLRDDPRPLRIGCVATNQPRKDLGLLFASVAALKAQGHPVALWLHTDILTKAWGIGELASSFAFQKGEVAVSTDELTDTQLCAQYAWSDVTLAPGLGEGFGYPIVESLASGTPVVHGRYAGGAELIPHPRWLVDPVAWRLESCYAVQRPVFRPEDVAAALLEAATWKRAYPALCQAYCAGAMDYLSWKSLWPRWRSWIERGLQARRQPALQEAVSG